ncbi:hypothetical protein SAM40697_4600 [Streptomyces ambofaciens]|uniref:Secreted protein n=1 Tax=Streptomyces ambofaciens TaxID=1889 RepID=A0ABN4PDZ7_STRAM|nr:hypothetical protein SAM40697_4600 [Streptomyces ambofaciens]
MRLVQLEQAVAATSALTTLITVPVTLLAAHWNRRSTDRAADATMVAGIDQSQAAVAAAQLQERAVREQSLESARRSAYAGFLSAVDLFVRIVTELPDIPRASRRELLDQKATAVVQARAGVAVLGPAPVFGQAEKVAKQCARLEKLALRRAVLRSAISALESAWCPRNAEWCQDPHHNSAHVAWELLCEWGRLEDEERWEKLDLLEFTLQESQALDAEQVKHVLEVANCVASWDEMIGGFVRDPLLERFQAVRDEFADVAYGSLGLVA